MLVQDLHLLKRQRLRKRSKKWSQWCVVQLFSPILSVRPVSRNDWAAAFTPTSSAATISGQFGGQSRRPHPVVNTQCLGELSIILDQATLQILDYSCSAAATICSLWANSQAAFSIMPG